LALATVIYCFQVESTDLNLLVSWGSCFMMSGESKIGWRYIHWPWHFTHSSSVSDTSISLALQTSISSSNGFLNGENYMA